MKYRYTAQISQVKVSSLASSNANNLFNRFSIKEILKKSLITKSNGHGVQSLLYIMLLMILENSRSVFSGICKLQVKQMKNPINNLLNNKIYNWRNLLFGVARKFSALCPASENGLTALIIDDTAKKKTGRKGEGIAWFVDHCTQAYYMGFQNIVAAWHNGRLTIPIDLELKLGKSKCKHSRKSRNPRGTHTETRVRMAKRKKTEIALSMIKRALQRGFKFQYILWDSWYNNSDSLRYVFEVLRKKSVHLVAMVRRDEQKYKYGNQYLTIKELYKRAGKWRTSVAKGLKHKSIVVRVLDKKSSREPESQRDLGEVRMCFFKYPGQKMFRVIVSTNQDLSELEVLSIYLRRWAIEVVFKDLKQYFGYDQSKSSNYAPQIADLTIRCVFYIMFCSLKHESPGKSTVQLMIEFYTEMEDEWLDIYTIHNEIIQSKKLLVFAQRKGYKRISELLTNFDLIIREFFESTWTDNKIEEIDYCQISRLRYSHAG